MDERDLEFELSAYRIGMIAAFIIAGICFVLAFLSALLCFLGQGNSLDIVIIIVASIISVLFFEIGKADFTEFKKVKLVING